MNINDYVEKKEENLIKIKNEKEFLEGKLEGIVVKLENDKVNMILEDKNKKGIYTSKVFNVRELLKAVISWNAETPKNTYIEIEARVFVVTKKNISEGEWSKWLSWGKWGTEIERSSVDTEGVSAKINTDVLIVKNPKINLATKIQFRVKFNSETCGNTPILKKVAITYKGEVSYSEIHKIKNMMLYEKIIETPKISQYLREESIASRVCSPTSITMMLNRMGETLIVEDIAWKCYDYKYEGFGNWAFNVALAGSLGYESYVRFGSIQCLLSELKEGYPVGVSVKYTNDKNEKKYPYIENAPVTTAGHLLVVVGVERNNKGEAFIVVNDPAGKDNYEVRRRYRIEEFLEAWNASENIMYIIKKR